MVYRYYVTCLTADYGGLETVSTTWEQKGNRITSLSNAAKMRIRLYYLMNSGWVAYDDVTLAKADSETKYSYAGGQRVAVRVQDTLDTSKSGLFFLASDHLGSTTITTDSGGNLVSKMLYDPWGKVRYSSGATPTDYTYTGQYSYTDDFGLMFYNARWYDSSLSRWTQPDPMVPLATQGVQAWDRYAYVSNNPVKYDDPSGHDVGCGGRDASECSQNITPDYRNLTNWIVSAAVSMATSAEMQRIKLMNGISTSLMEDYVISGLDGDPSKDMLVAAIKIKGNAYESFVGMVGNGQEFDVKDKINSRLGGEVYLGNDWYEYSTPGNILYGFYGAAAGFSDLELHGGAGVAQLRDLFLDSDHPLPGSLSTGFDTKNDFYAIEFGIFLYNNYFGDGELTTEEFLAALEVFKYTREMDHEPSPKDYYPAPEEYSPDEFNSD